MARKSYSALRNYPALLALAFLVLTSAVSLGSDSPSRTSSFFGTLELDGPLPDDTILTASIAGSELASTRFFSSPEGPAFRIDVPGDVSGTPEIEGGQDGQTVSFRIGNTDIAETGVWQLGTYQRLDLTAGLGADLAVTVDDGVTMALPAQSLTYSVTVTHVEGPVAGGVLVVFDVPESASFVFASDGGTFADGVVTWPVFDLLQGSTSIRTVTVELASSFPADADSILGSATVTSDGRDGIDPDPASNTALDVDVLDAEPDLAITKSDGEDEADPGAELTYVLSVTNAGTQDAARVELVDTLPAEVLFLTASDDGIESTPGVVTWPAFPLAVGETASRTLTVRVDETPVTASVLNEASAVPGNGPDGDLSDNTASDETSILQRADLSVAGVDLQAAVTDPQALAISGEVTVTVENLGNADLAEDVEVTVFEDLDLDERFAAATDNLLGQRILPAGVAAGAVATVAVPVSGTVLFVDNRLHVFVDSAGILDELDEADNVRHSAEDCQVIPVPEDFEPVLELSWPDDDPALLDPLSVESLSTPIVVQLTDDNGDGRIDGADVPDVVFVTANLVNPLDPRVKLRAVRGDTGRSIFSVDPPVSQFLTFSLSGLAAGDLDGDGDPEIVVATPSPPVPPFDGFSNHLTAYDHRGVRLWSSGAYVTHPTGATFTNRDNPAIADLDGDGFAEIVVGANVFDRFGQLRWAGGGGQGYQSARNDDGVDSGAISIVADLDLEGDQEVVTGNTAYRADGSVYWQVAMDDGYPAVANFDGDAFPEIVVVARGRVRLHQHDGSLIWGPVELPGAGAEAGGAPTVADFDGDGEPEIGVAGSTQYAVFETDGTVKWQRTIQDGSSNMSGSTVFDLDGDGRFEVIYRDETHLRIYRGEDGVVLFEDAVSSFTANEQPVVADVDGDGRAEIVVTSDLASQLGGIPVRTAGLRIYGDARDNWVGTRGIWNQHGYHADNVADDGGIPARPAPSWLGHNTFRANVAPPEGAFAAADLSASKIEVDLGAYPTLGLTVRVGNGGLTASAVGIPVTFYDGDPGAGGEAIATAIWPAVLRPGEMAEIAAVAESPGFGAASVVAEVGDGAGGGGRRECNLENNRYGITYDTGAVGLLLVTDDGRSSVHPGDRVSYALAVSNASAFERSGVTVSDVLPPHTAVVEVSDGGSESGGVVTWPPFALPAGATAIRTLTFEVDPALPLDVVELTNTASVSDDGSQGPEPSPTNNTAVDTNRVASVMAVAGGPYAGEEGTPILFDASASFDRDGTIVSYAWDLDGDGIFGDATGVSVSHAFPDDGSFAVGLQVRDDSGETDSATAAVEIGNRPAAVDAGGDRTVTEGDAVTLAAVFDDPGIADTHSATVDWGDGTTEAAAVVESGGSGTVSVGHIYDDNGVFAVEVCVSDDDGATACDTSTVTVDNAVPVVVESGEIDFTSWTAEHWRPSFPGVWSVAAGGRTVIQQGNGDPSAFYGPFTAIGRTFEGTLRVNTGADDDYIGFVLGFHPGDFSNPDSEYLLIDWKQKDQVANGLLGRQGLAISRVRGADSNEFLAHVNTPDNGPEQGVEELQRAFNLGSVGWGDFVTYSFRIETDPTSVRVFVDGTLELDVSGDFRFGSGRFGFYNFSQQSVLHDAFTARGLAVVEGEIAELEAAFSDAGLLDLHTATIDWQDGTVGTGTVAESPGGGEVTGSHLYLDDGELEVEVCVSDDDGGSGCAIVPVTVHNLPPEVDAGGDRQAFREDGLDLSGASFSDAGVLDTHLATVDWGDGTVEEIVVVAVDGTGSIDASHFYEAAGTYAVEICVEDDDGGRACDAFEARILESFVDLGVLKTADRAFVVAGEEVSYILSVANRGTLPATGLVLTDTLPAGLSFVAAGSGGVYDAVAHRVAWNLGALAAGESTEVSLVAVTDAGVPFGTALINEARVSDDGASGADASLSDNLAGFRVRMWDEVTPRVLIGGEGRSPEGATYDLAVSFVDFNAAETHTAWIDWGDGTSEAGDLFSGGGAGTVTGSHVYPDDGIFPIEVCVTDSGGLSGCDRLELEVFNLAAVVSAAGGADLDTWTVESLEVLPQDQDEPTDWQFAADGASVVQHANSPPTWLVSSFGAVGNELEGALRVETATDDDFIGFALGFEPGDGSRPSADFLLVNWKQADQGASPRGLFASRVLGIPEREEFWLRGNLGSPEEGIFKLAEGLRFGRAGWQDFTTYRFRFRADPDRLRVWVDDQLELDLEVELGDGRFAFYNHSQPEVRYSTFRRLSLRLAEGELATLTASFEDAGVFDTHSATVDWRDGTVAAVEVDEEGGAGALSAEHVYLEDGVYSVEVCVVDNGGETGCGELEIRVDNLAPSVDAESGQGFAGVLFVLPPTLFSDPGILDVHSATIDWGDGATGSGQVEESGGAGTVTGSHVYAGEGTYTVEVCVLDDEGASGCDTATVEIDAQALLTIDDVTVEEGAGEARFTVTLSTPADREVTVDFTTAEGSAFEDEDFLAAAGTVVLPAGETVREVAVPIVDDLILEPDEETFTVELANPSGAMIAEGVGVGTILDEESCPGPNLLTNPGAEARIFGSEEIPGWRRESGDFLRLVTSEAVEGEAIFAGGSAELSELVQDVDMSAYAERIATGEQEFLFGGFVRTFDEVPPDVVRVLVEYRDTSGEVVLEVYDSGEIASPFEWMRIEDVRPAPAGTGRIRVRLLASRFAGEENDAFVDALELRSLRTPAVTVDDVTLGEGDGEPLEAVFTVSLSCPYFEPVTLDYATSDGLAMAVEDYQAVASSLGFETGETARPVAVSIVGDALHEFHEDFSLDLGSSLPAEVVVADPRGVALILNDDFCPRSPGFWKTHEELWPSDHLEIGGVGYGVEELLDFLGGNARDATLALARQLVATKLNLEVGSDVAILPVVEAADAFLVEYPPGSDPRGAPRGEANALKDELDAYNNPDPENGGCVETPVIPPNDELP